MQDLQSISQLYGKVEVILDGYTSPAVACRAGCAHCCHLPVDVSAAELMALLQHLLANREPTELERIRQAAQSYSTVSAGTPEADRAAVRMPCALLVNDQCSAYEVRPLACRAFHSADVDYCVDAFRPENVRRTIEIADPRRLLVASKAGAMLAKACQSAGKDTRAYDLGTALAAALAAPGVIQQRWADGEELLPGVKPV